MKRLSLLTLLVALLSVTAFAQKGVNPRLVQKSIQSQSPVMMNMSPRMMKAKPQMLTATPKKVKTSPRMMKGALRQSQTVTNKPRRIAAANELVTPPETATTETLYTYQGKFYVNTSSGWSNATSYKESITIAIDGEDFYIQGLAYWFEDAWIKGTIDGDKVVFENSQFIGEDDYGSEYLVGTDDWETLSDNIVFSYDAEEGILAAETTYILENGSEDEIEAYCYWSSPTFLRELPEVVPPSTELVTPPETATMETFYTFDGIFYVYSSGWKNATSLMESITVAIDGNDIYIQGLAYWFEDAWIKGTIDGNMAIFAGPQFIGEDEYGAEYLVGSDDGETFSDIVFYYDAEEGILYGDTPFIIENASYEEVDPYCYWSMPTFFKNPPEVVTPPEDLVTDDYVIVYVDREGNPGYGSLTVGFDGNDVYIQGFCSYLPDAWMKGTLDGETITFPGAQYFGPYGNYKIFLQGLDVVFTYDKEADKMIASDDIYTITFDGLLADSYSEAVILKVVEKAGVPSTPTISEIYESSYGPIAYFTIPLLDVDGNPMVSSKLSFQFFYQVGDEVYPVTFDPDDYYYLEEAMTVIPYGFSEDYDFYANAIYLNMDFSDWDKIGIQSIYTGGGEENVSEIFWFNLKEEEFPMGDVNHDGQVNVTDVMLVVDYVMGNNPPVFFEDQADVTGDGDITVSDVTAIVDIALNGQVKD
ncbi:MAG: dockerin type I repeat-containing protein [Prevotella sp.]|nr:dockerin type I repeat-containing protein [Prevotella sp.]